MTRCGSCVVDMYDTQSVTCCQCLIVSVSYHSGTETAAVVNLTPMLVMSPLEAEVSIGLYVCISLPSVCTYLYISTIGLHVCIYISLYHRSVRLYISTISLYVSVYLYHQSVRPYISLCCRSVRICISLPSVCTSVYLSLSLSIIGLYVCISLSSVCTSVYLYHRSVRLYIISLSLPSVCTSVYLYHQSVHICISVSAADRNVVHTVISSTPVVFTLCFLDSELIAPLRQNAKVSLESFWGTGSSSSWWSSLLDCITNVCSSSRSQQPRDWTFLSHVDCFSQCETSQSGNRVSTSLGNSGRCWTIFARNRDTAVPAEGNGNLQTLICVLVARPRLCLTLSNPVPWQKFN